ncbi:MAG: hypothetical protein AW09_000695 [Candidatus Accumulibacter phosphatis]|uniref:Uncharacterized protein n=1 Tax=Candidatus Accumulibacter phosphatis TaxID=327160 RepID=A0A080LYS2_9PROT|nr:MAG: hypothetical protein AW09_000695 [Candidatus Accumulibacter phosphatis]
MSERSFPGPKCIAGAVGDRGLVEDHLVLALCQRRQGDLYRRTVLRDGYRVDGDGMTELVQQVDALCVERFRIHRFGESDPDRTELRAVHRSIDQIRTEDRRREGIRDEFDDERIGERGVAAGVGGACLDRGAGRRRRKLRQRDGGGPGEGNVVGDDLAVDEQFDVAHLHIVGDIELDIE